MILHLLPPLRRGALMAAMLLLALGVASDNGRAADPQPYSVTIVPTGEAPLDAALRDSSLLVTLDQKVPVGPFALVVRARDDVTRFIAALHSFGYYQGGVTVTIDGRSIDDPGLPGALAAVPAGKSVPVVVRATPGTLFHIGRLSLDGEVPQAARAQLGLKEGDPARAADVLAARDRLQTALLQQGYAFAKVDPPLAVLDPSHAALDITFKVDTGPRADLGPITIAGLTRLHEDYVRRRLLLRQGEQFDPRRIEAAREDLGSVGAIGGVRISTADQLDPQGQLPVRVDVTERALRTVDLSAAYSTDLGVSLGASWTHHDLFGEAEQLTLSAAVTGLTGTAVHQPGYNLGAKLVLPDWHHRDQTLSFSAIAVKEYLDAYDRTAAIIGTALSRRIAPHLNASIGLTGEQAHFVQQGVGQDYTLLQTPLSLNFDNTGSLLDATHGVRATALVTPTESFGHVNSTFVIAQANAATYLDLAEFDLTGPGRSVLAVHGVIGSVIGASTFEIPPDQRFYGGGSGTVRGFRYQSIGPQFSPHHPIGGTSIGAAQFEFRQRIGESYGAVAFVDAGQVGSNGVPFSGTVEVGAGVGARYYTPIGPIRLDVAVPVTSVSGGDALEVYIGIGQAF